jgi:hypothetical protein
MSEHDNEMGGVVVFLKSGKEHCEAMTRGQFRDLADRWLKASGNLFGGPVTFPGFATDSRNIDYMIFEPVPDDSVELIDHNELGNPVG